MDLPGNVSTGTVVGRYISDVIDGADANLDPDAVAVQGRIVFMSSVKYLPIPNALPAPVTILRKPIVGVLDTEGYLCTPYPGTMDPMYRGVSLIATDDPDVAVKNWTWDVTYLFEPVDGHRMEIEPHGFSLPGNSLPVDLTQVAKVPSSPGYSLPQAEAAALRAESAAAASASDAALAVAAADRAELVAGATDAGVALLLGDSGTETGALLDGALAPKADTADVDAALGTKADLVGGVVPDEQTPSGVAAELTNLGEIKADKSTVENELAFKADLENGKVPDAQTPAGVTSSLNGKVGKGDLVVNALDYGAVPSPTVDQSASLNAAAAAALAIGGNAKLLVPRGNYRIDSTVMFRCALDASEATFTYYGAGTAVILGSDQAGVVTARQNFRAPRVIKAGRVTGWDGTTVGIQANNLNTCEVYIPFVQDFEQGFVAYGNAGGYAYTNHYLGAIWENHKNLVLTNTVNGYTNQNQFYGGRLQHSLTKGATENDPNASQIYMVSTNPEGGPNNNTFIGTSIEGENVALDRVDIAGSYNQFINCRWESPGNIAVRVRYRATALNNAIKGGWGSGNIVEIFDGTLGGGNIDDPLGSYTSATLAAPAQSIPDNVSTTITGWNTPVGRRITLDPATGRFKPRPGRWMIGASVTFAPNATGRRIASIIAGGSNIDISEAPGNAVRTTLKLNATFRFNGQQEFEVKCTQTSGAALALEATVPYVRVWAEYLGH